MAGKPTAHLIERKCPVCGKSFFAYPEHVYKDKRTKRLVCSWGCVCKSERLKEEAKAAREAKRKQVSR